MEANHFSLRSHLCQRWLHRPLMASDRTLGRGGRPGERHQVPSQLRQEPCPVLWIQRGTGRCGHHHGCRPGQDSPDEIPELYRMITQEGYDLVSGYKQNRKQGYPLSKTIPTKLFNATARKVSGIHNLHYFNCGLKAYRRDVVKNIEVYGEMHRYIPYLARTPASTR